METYPRKVPAMAVIDGLLYAQETDGGPVLYTLPTCTEGVLYTAEERGTIWDWASTIPVDESEIDEELQAKLAAAFPSSYAAGIVAARVKGEA